MMRWRPQSLRPVVWALLLALLAVYLRQAHYYRHYVNDDAYITFRYSRNLAEGHGPYFNVGEHVEGYTSPLMMLVMALAIGALGPASAPAVAKALGVASAAAAILLTFLLVRKLLGKTTEAYSAEMVDAGALAAAGIVAASPAFAVNSQSGLETIAFSLLIVLGVLLDASDEGRRRWLGSALAFSAAALTRPEGFLLFGVYAVAKTLIVTVPGALGSSGRGGPRSQVGRLVASRPLRADALGALVVACAFLGLLGLRYLAYDGEWLPNTYYAKQSGFWAIDAGTYVARGLLLPAFGVGGLAVALAGYAFGRARPSREFLPFAILTVASACVPFLTGTDYMLGWRLAIPYLPLTAILIAVGWLLLAGRVPWPRTWMLAILAVAVVGPLWLWQDGSRREFHEYTETRWRGYQTGHMAVAGWLASEAKRGDTIALMDIGIVGYLCPDQFILDLTGLTDRFIATSAGRFLHKDYDPRYVLDRRPEFVVLTLSAPGRSYEVPPPGTSFRTWTPTERRLAEHPEFARSYVRTRPVPDGASGWVDAFACRIGAERVFEHAHPGFHYLLAVYRRRADAPFRGP